MVIYVLQQTSRQNLSQNVKMLSITVYIQILYEYTKPLSNVNVLSCVIHNAILQ